MLSSYLILRNHAAKLRGYGSLAAELILFVWLVTAAAGISLSVQSIKHPAGYSEWAELLRLTAYGSFLLGIAGFCLAYSVRQAHQSLWQRCLAPQPAPRTETAAEVAA